MPDNAPQTNIPASTSTNGLSNVAQAHSHADTHSSVLGDVVDPRQYLGIIMQYWWLIFLMLLLGTGLAAAYCVLATPLYRATCRYELFRESRLNFVDGTAAQQGGPTVDEELSRQIVIMKSGTLHGRVMEILRPKHEEKLTAEQMLPKIDVNRLREAVTMVDIYVDSISPEYSVDYLERMLDVYRDMRREEIMQSTDKAVDSLRREQTAIGDELDNAQLALANFRKQHNLIYTETKGFYDERFLANLVQRENALRMEQTLLESQFDFLQTADPNTIQDALRLTLETQLAAQDFSGVPVAGDTGGGSMTAGSMTAGSMAGTNANVTRDASGMRQLQWGQENEWQRVQAEVERLKADFSNRLETYLPEHPQMILLKQEIDTAERNLALAAKIALNRLEARFTAVKLQREAVRTASQDWRRELDLTTEQRADHARLQAKANHLSKIYDRVYTRILDGSVVDVDALFSRLIEQVRAQTEPVWPAKVKIMLLAIIASLGLGIGGAFMLDHMDTRFLDALGIEDRLRIPYISGVPDWNRVIKRFNPNSHGLLVSHETGDVSTETYRAMRAGVEHVITPDHPYVLLLTSGEDGEGKTMTAVNLAVLFAWSGKKVLMVDADLRRGSCHPFFGVTREPGMNEYFMGTVSDWHELIRDSGHENLDFIPAGRYQHEVPEMLSSTRLDTVMDEWRREYDLVIMDSAPAGRVVDTALLGRAADGVLLVVRHGKASFGSVRHALHRLLDAKLVGFCLNGIQLGQRKYSYYSRYGRYYYGRYAQPYGRYYDRYGDEEAQAAPPPKKAAVASTGNSGEDLI